MPVIEFRDLVGDGQLFEPRVGLRKLLLLLLQLEVEVDGLEQRRQVARPVPPDSRHQDFQAGARHREEGILDGDRPSVGRDVLEFNLPASLQQLWLEVPQAGRRGGIQIGEEVGSVQRAVGGELLLEGGVRINHRPVVV